MRIIGFGELYLDYYFKNDKLLGVMGGKNNANILSNLSSYFDTAYIGYVGNDSQGKICVDSLNKLGIDTSNIIIKDIPTKKNYITKDGYTSICPYCSRDLNHKENIYDLNEIINNINKDDYLVIDNLTDETVEILKKVNNKAFLSLSYIGALRYHSLDEIIELLNNRFEMIFINEKVYNYFKKKFDIDSRDLYDYINTKVLIITRGKRGADIIFEDYFEKKENENRCVEIDLSGAEEVFISEYIHVYLTEDELNLKVLGKTYLKAISLYSYVSTLNGARTHLIPLVKINNYKECICKAIEYDNL